MDAIRITAVQTDIVWEDPIANFERLDSKLNGIKGETDLIVLPEMFSTGFSMNPIKHAEAHPGPALKWMQSKAIELEAALCGSVMVSDEGKYYNRLYFVFPDGSSQHYDKRHLFSLAGEQDHFTAGRERLIVEYKGWRICPLICFDLRFPVWSRNHDAYDLLIYVASWPDARIYAWRQLLIARAIENQTYVVGVNRIGDDGTPLHYNGSTCVIDSLGAIYNEISDKEELVQTTLLKSNLEKMKQKLPFLAESDYFALDLDRRSFSGRLIS